MTNWNFHYEDIMFNIGFWTQSPAQMTNRRWSNILLWFRGKISGRKNVKINLHFLLTFCLVGSSCFLLRFVLFFSFYFSRRIVFSYTTLIGWFNCTDHPIRKQKCTAIFIFLIIDRVIYLYSFIDNWKSIFKIITGMIENGQSFNLGRNSVNK